MSEFKVVGDLNWTELRDFIVMQLLNAETEERVVELIKRLVSSMGTVEDIQNTRRKLGIPLLTDDEIKELEK